jgi:hypothetical protein
MCFKSVVLVGVAGEAMLMPLSAIRGEGTKNPHDSPATQVVPHNGRVGRVGKPVKSAQKFMVERIHWPSGSRLFNA